jgi:hypothetical protein
MKRSKTVLRLACATLVTAFALNAAAASCEFNVLIKTLAPHSMNGYTWGNVIRPQGDACIYSVVVDPGQNSAWYAGGYYGLYMTKDHGQTWTKPLTGNVGAVLLVPPDIYHPHLVYAAVSNKLYLSTNKGFTWQLIKTFPAPVSSLLFSEQRLYIGLGWGNHVDPSGVYMASYNAFSMTFYPFGPGHTGLIVWTISRDEVNNIIYAGTEIYDHPQPYKPPFFRSANGAVNWTNVNAFGALPWHVVQTAVRPGDGYVYALTEGAGLYGSATMGSSWTPPTISPGLGVALLMDPQLPTRLYAGRHETPSLNGGLYLSNDSGSTFTPIGLQDVTVGHVTLNGTGSRIYAATYGSGIYVAAVP